MCFVRTLTRLAILGLVFSLTSCGPPAEEIAMTVVTATAEVESTVSVALDETQRATDVPTQPAGWCTGCVVQCLRISISLTPSGLRLHAITEKIEYSPELNDWGIT